MSFDNYLSPVFDNTSKLVSQFNTDDSSTGGLNLTAGGPTGAAVVLAANPTLAATFVALGQAITAGKLSNKYTSAHYEEARDHLQRAINALVRAHA